MEKVEKWKATYYYKIPGLLIPKSARYNVIHDGINNYIDTISSFAESIEGNFANIDSGKRHGFFIDNMELLIARLGSLYARALESDGERILYSVKTDPTMSVAHKKMKLFISSLLTLSIAMQRAQIDTSVRESSPMNEIEANTDMADNLSAVSSLIERGRYEKALSIIEAIEELNPDADMGQLLDLITTKKYKEAENLADARIEQYREIINKSEGSDLSKTILAVDDRPEILTFVIAALKTHYKVIAVTGGKAAVKVLETQKPDLFILDIDMPEMDGFELACIIRNSADYKETPLIFLTGNSSRERVVKGMEIGCDDFIVKPSSHEILRTKAMKFLKQ